MQNGHFTLYEKNVTSEQQNSDGVSDVAYTAYFEIVSSGNATSSTLWSLAHPAPLTIKGTRRVIIGEAFGIMSVMSAIALAYTLL